MMREPVATTQTRQVRVVANILTKDDFFFRRLIVRTLCCTKTEGSRKVRLTPLKVMTL